MGLRQAGPLNLDVFMSLFARFVARLMTDHAHAEVVLTIQDGNLRQVRVSRNYLPGDLPKV